MAAKKPEPKRAPCDLERIMKKYYPDGATITPNKPSKPKSGKK